MKNAFEENSVTSALEKSNVKGFLRGQHEQVSSVEFVGKPAPFDPSMTPAAGPHRDDSDRRCCGRVMPNVHRWRVLIAEDQQHIGQCWMPRYLLDMLSEVEHRLSGGGGD